MKWKFFRARKRRERTFIHNLCPLCGRRRGASSADRVGRNPCVPPRSTHCSRRGTRAPPYRVRRSHGGGQGRSPLHVLCGTSGTPSPTHLAIARQSVDWRGNPFPARQRRADGTSRTPSPTHSVIASQSAPRSKCPWGTDWRGNPFPARQRRADGTSRTPSPTHSVIASQSAPRSKCPWGTDWRGNPFSHLSPP